MGVGEREIGDVLDDGTVQFDETGLDQLHHQYGGKHLGRRADLKERVGRHLGPGLPACPARGRFEDLGRGARGRWQSDRYLGTGHAEPAGGVLG